MHIYSVILVHNDQGLRCMCACMRACWYRISGGELFDDIVRRDHYSEADARLAIYCAAAKTE